MKRKILNLFLVAVLSLAFLGCKAETVITEENEETNTEEIASSTEQNVTEENSTDSIDDFNDFVEVSFEHYDYPEIDDDNPDYSGIYCIGNYSTTYGYCQLIKQEDGSYYYQGFVEREISFEGTAIYQSDNFLELQGDSKGTITVDGDTVDVNLIEGEDAPYQVSFANCKYEMPDLTDYLGKYTYTTDDGKEFTATVDYDEHRAPVITVEYEGETIEFVHSPSDYGIFIMEDEYLGNILYASIEKEPWAPDSEVFSFTKNYSGDKYLVINLNEDKPQIYYKVYNAKALH